MREFLSLLLIFSFLFLGANVSHAWELPDPLEPPYEIEANCGGSCQIQLGSYLEAQKGAK